MRKILLLLLLTTSAAAAPAMFRGDAAHRGVYTAIGSKLVGMQWRFPTGGDVISSPAVAGGFVYIGSGDGKLYAIDELTGVQRWAFEAGSPVHSSPAIAGDTLYFVTRKSVLIALDAKRGKLRWSVTTGADAPWPWGHESGDFYISSPVLANDLVLFGGGDGTLYAVDAARGAIRWKALTGDRIRATPAVADGGVYVGNARGRLYRFELATGRKEWTFDTAGAALDSGKFGWDRTTLQSSPAVADGVVYVGSRDGSFYAVDAKSGKLRWKKDDGFPWVITSPAVADGHVFIGSSDGHYVASLDAATGKEDWKTNVDVLVWSSPAVASDAVIAGDGAGRVNAFDRMTGKQLWTFRAGTSDLYSSPAVDGDLVFIGSTDGAVYALRTGATEVRRGVYMTREIPKDANGDLASFFERRGYTRLDETTLPAFLAADGPSVVVFTIDEAPSDPALLRSYLDRGGKVVWSGIPPLLYPRAKRTSLGNIDFTAPQQLLGIDTTHAIFDERGSTPTADGMRWGLSGRWRDNWGVTPSSVTTVLSTDEWGSATAYVKSFGGPAGTGFVRVPALDNKLTMYWAAEYRPEAGTAGSVGWQSLGHESKLRDLRDLRVSVSSPVSPHSRVARRESRERRPPRARAAHDRAALQHDLEVTVCQRPHGRYAGQADDGRAMDAREARRVELGLEVAHSLTDRMRLAGRVNPHVIVLRLDPLDGLERDAHYLGAIRQHEMRRRFGALRVRREPDTDGHDGAPRQDGAGSEDRQPDDEAPQEVVREEQRNADDGVCRHGECQPRDEVQRRTPPRHPPARGRREDQRRDQRPQGDDGQFRGDGVPDAGIADRIRPHRHLGRRDERHAKPRSRNGQRTSPGHRSRMQYG
jgi:outer membrane protein assembly factor BamB